MAIVVPDIACLREPNLLIPKKLPIGPVKIDWSHPLAKKIKACWMFNTGAPINLVDGSGPYDMGDMLIDKGMYWPKAGSSTYLWVPNVCTELGNCIEAIGDNWNTSYASYLYDTTGGSGKRDLLYRTSGGAVYFYTKGVTDNYIPVFDFTAKHNYIVRLGSNKFYVDGNVDNDYMDSTAIIPYDYMIIGSRYSNNQQFGGHIETFRIWESLTDKEIKELSVDPYQFLIPA